MRLKKKTKKKKTQRKVKVGINRRMYVHGWYCIVYYNL